MKRARTLRAGCEGCEGCRPRLPVHRPGVTLARPTCSNPLHDAAHPGLLTRRHPRAHLRSPSARGGGCQRRTDAALLAHRAARARACSTSAYQREPRSGPPRSIRYRRPGSWLPTSSRAYPTSPGLPCLRLQCWRGPAITGRLLQTSRCSPTPGVSVPTLSEHSVSSRTVSPPALPIAAERSFDRTTDEAYSATGPFLPALVRFCGNSNRAA